MQTTEHPSFTSLTPAEAADAQWADVMDRRSFAQVVGEATSCLEEKGIPYGLIGGVASSRLGRPRTTRDLDLFVKPHDAGRVIEALAERGFETERTDPKWIYKAFKEGIQVDVIFKTVADIYLDEEMLRRLVTATFAGHQVRLIPPEDLVLIKALAHDEASPRHWFDALAILAATELDWDYLVHRGRRAERRLLALLVYAQSLDIHVPKRAIRSLFFGAYAS